MKPKDKLATELHGKHGQNGRAEKGCWAIARGGVAQAQGGQGACWQRIAPLWGIVQAVAPMICGVRPKAIRLGNGALLPLLSDGAALLCAMDQRALAKRAHCERVREYGRQRTHRQWRTWPCRVESGSAGEKLGTPERHGAQQRSHERARNAQTRRPCRQTKQQQRADAAQQRGAPPGTGRRQTQQHTAERPNARANDTENACTGGEKGGARGSAERAGTGQATTTACTPSVGSVGNAMLSRNDSITLIGCLALLKVVICVLPCVSCG